MAPPSQRLRRMLPLLGGTLIVVLVVGGLIWLIRDMQKQGGGPKRQVAQQVQLIRPQPQPEEPKPTPPPEEEKIEEPLPQETPEEAPAEDAGPPEQLGVEGPGVAGGDDFGLQSRKGGRDLTGTGGAAFAWYTSGLKERIFDMLADDERIRRARYQVTFRVWVSSDGAIEQIKFQSTSGDRALDQAIEDALERMKRAPDAPPLEMPQPITFRIVSK